MRTVDRIKFGATCVLEYTNGRGSTTGNELSLANYLQIDLEGTIEYALTQTTSPNGYILIRLTRANSMYFYVNWTSYTDLAEFDPYGAGCLLVRKANGKWRMCVDHRALNARRIRD